MENNITKLLSEKMPEEAIQRTRKEDTRKGYNTDGYSYQFCVDRLNEVAGDKWFFTWGVIHEEKGAYKSGMPYYDITVKVEIWISPEGKGRSCVGGHTAMTYADALKGAITNGFKKTAAFWGVGRDAYAGTIDDDNNPLPDEAKNKIAETVNFAAKKTPEEALKFFEAFRTEDKDVNAYFQALTKGEKWTLCNACNWSLPEIDAHIIKILLNKEVANG